MQESEFTGCSNKVQGNPAIKREKHRNHGLFAPSRKNNPAAALTLRCASCTMNSVRALSSAVRAFGLHPKGRPFKSDSAHHCDPSPFSGECAELLGCRLSSHAFIRGRVWVQLNAFSNVGKSRCGKSYVTTARYYRGGWSRLQLGSGSDMLVALSAAVQAKTSCAHVPDAGNGRRLFLSRSLGRLGPWGRLQPRVHVPRCAEGRSLCGVGNRIRASSVLHVLHGREIGGKGTQ